MKHLRTLQGYRPLTFVPDGILLAKGYDLYVASLDCSRLDWVAAAPHTLAAGTLRRSRMIERILRLGIRFGCRIDEGCYLLAERNRLWLLELPAGTVRLDHVIENGMKPLWISRIHGIEDFEDGACFGEYWYNASKAPVNIWVRSQLGIWRVAYTFPAGTIEHVHGIVPDERRGIVWILTGDSGDSVGIWAARRNFSEVLPVLVGKQDFRCCWLAFSDDQIIYATDSPVAINSVRRLILPPMYAESKDPWIGSRSEPFMEISGSSIYSCRLQNQVVFSTTVEPGLLTGNKLRDWLERRRGAGIKGMYSDLMIGTQAGFSLAGRWAKDPWPLRLCEFGSISFPTGINPGSRLYAYFTGLTHRDGSMSVFELSGEPIRTIESSEVGPAFLDNVRSCIHGQAHLHYGCSSPEPPDSSGARCSRARFRSDGGRRSAAIPRRGFAPIKSSSAISTGNTDWSGALTDIDCVVHLAARVHVMNPTANDRTAFERTNVLGTERLARAAAAAGVHRFIYLSSIKVNGESTSDRAFRADDVPRPEDDYARSKLEAERRLSEVAAASGMTASIIRPPLVYGAGVRANFLRLLSLAHSGLPIPLGAILNARSMVSVWNLCDLICALLQREQPMSGVFLVADGEGVSTAELVRRLARIMRRPSRLFAMPVGALRAVAALTGRSAELDRLCNSLVIDMAQTRARLGWSPPLTLDAGLAKTVNWYLQLIANRAAT